MKNKIFLALAMTFAAQSFAGGLQVSPISIDLLATQNAEGLSLINSIGQPLNAQVRAYKWTQVDGKDKLESSRGILVSPPMVKLPAGETQLVRVMRLSAPPSDVEDAYRLIVEEIPSAVGDGKPGVKFSLKYSVPVFVKPPGIAGMPSLAWTVTEDKNGARLEVTNTGTAHAQIAALTITDSGGKPTALVPGLLGYVLAKSTMRWQVKTPGSATQNAWTAMINGVNQKISFVDAQ